MKKTAFCINLIFAVIIGFALTGCVEQKADSTGTSDSYSLTTCVVSGEKLSGMGEPRVIVHEGVTVKFCCADCVDEFNKDPAKYVAKVKAA